MSALLTLKPSTFISWYYLGMFPKFLDPPARLYSGKVWNSGYFHPPPLWENFDNLKKYIIYLSADMRNAWSRGQWQQIFFDNLRKFCAFSTEFFSDKPLIIGNLKAPRKVLNFSQVCLSALVDLDIFYLVDANILSTWAKFCLLFYS